MSEKDRIVRLPRQTPGSAVLSYCLARFKWAFPSTCLQTAAADASAVGGWMVKWWECPIGSVGTNIEEISARVERRVTLFIGAPFVSFLHPSISFLPRPARFRFIVVRSFLPRWSCCFSFLCPGCRPSRLIIQPTVDKRYGVLQTAGLHGPSDVLVFSSSPSPAASNPRPAPLSLQAARRYETRRHR